MATHTRPAETWVTCDACGVKCDRYNRRTNTTILVKSNALDYQGGVVGPANSSKDLCDECAEPLVRAINDARKESQ